jgi:hypothetical protein
MTRNVQTNFRAQDMLGSIRDKPAAKKAAASEPQKTAQPDPNKVPEGTTQEVLDWVDNEPSKARKALAEEKKSDDPRVTLTEPLEKIIEDDKAAKKQAAADKKAAEKKSE